MIGTRYIYIEREREREREKTCKLIFFKVQPWFCHYLYSCLWFITNLINLSSSGQLLKSTLDIERKNTDGIKKHIYILFQTIILDDHKHHLLLRRQFTSQVCTHSLPTFLRSFLLYFLPSILSFLLSCLLGCLLLRNQPQPS